MNNNNNNRSKVTDEVISVAHVSEYKSITKQRT